MHGWNLFFLNTSVAIKAHDSQRIKEWVYFVALKDNVPFILFIYSLQPTVQLFFSSLSLPLSSFVVHLSLQPAVNSF